MLLVLAQCIQHTDAAGEPDYIGFVVDDETGEPVPDAKVTVYYRRLYRRYSSRWYSSSGTTTDADGRFQLDLNEDYAYLFLVTHEENGIHDYVPYCLRHNQGEIPGTKEIRLWKADTVTLEGRDFFIETTAIPDITVRVLDSETLNPVSYGNIGLYYGTGAGTLSSYLDLPIESIQVPRDMDYSIRITARVENEGEQLTETILLEGDQRLAPVNVNLRSIVLPRNLEKIHNITGSTETLLIEKEEQGFFLAVERQKLSRAETLITTALGQIQAGELEESFTILREAYVILSDLERSVTTLYESATRSVFILILFIGVTSQILATLLFEDDGRKIITGSLVFMVLLGALIWLHPGAQITEQTLLIRMGGVTLLCVTCLGILAPRFLQRGEKNSTPHLRYMAIPMLSIAKRSLRRRKLRFLLTLTSVLLLVASFISLTSFSSGFGLSLERVGEPMGKEGIMIRTPDPPPTMDTAPFSGGVGVSGPLPLDEGVLKWFRDEEGVSEVVPRYETHPRRQYREAYSPITSIGRVNIFGILSVDPSYEAKVNMLDTAVVDGGYLSGEVGEILISVELAEKLGVGVGESFTVGVQEQAYDFSVVGLMDDAVLAGLTDIDGDSLMPKKIIEWARIEYDGPDHVVEAIAPCTPDEVIILSHATSVNMTSLMFTRLNLVLDTGIDVVEYTRTTALNRGFRVWGSAVTGVYLAQLAEYFDGKGLPIMIPWVIVVLNVVVTMMNAYYERRNEVMIFSSIGMNPRHISSIFLAEATVTGVIGGCIGYLLGLGAYKFIYLVTPELQVQQKVSAVWSLGAIGISLAAVLIGGMVALRNSVSITPSLQRRWRLDASGDRATVTRIRLPVHVFPEELREYYDFLEDELKKRSTSGDMRVRMLKRVVDETAAFTFFYSSEGTNISRLYSKNGLVIELDEDGTYSTVLLSDGDSDSVKRAGVLMRRICLDWSMKREGH